MKNMIAIWAPLRYANYGDDLQSIVFAYFIRSLGYEVKVFQMDPELANFYGLETANTVDELCENSKLCIIAGGALLTPFSILHRTLSKTANEYEKDFRDLHHAGIKYGTKFCAISMGGDGKIRNPYLFYSLNRIKFFKSPFFINGTVRLEGDIPQMKKFGKEFEYYPDCLLQTPNFLKIEKDIFTPSDRPFRVAFNFKKKHLSQDLLNEIFKYAEINNDVEFYFVTTHLEKKGINYEYIPLDETENVKIEKYKTPTQLLEFISGIDILITSKLHLGITGLTVGTPFVSYRGPGKAKSFIESIGGKWAIVDDNITFQELKEKFFYKSKTELFNQYDVLTFQKMINDSYNQFIFCEKIVEKY